MWVKALYVVLAFCSVLCFGALKSLIIGPIAGSIIVLGNLGIILGLLPAHVSWTVYTIIKTNRFDAPLKIAILSGLPALFGIWLALSIAGSVLVGLGYGFFTPWVASFEAFRLENESTRLFHSIVDGTWGTIKGSCTVVQDFSDICIHSYLSYLKEIRENLSSNDLQPIRFIHIPACIIVAILGLIVEIPTYTVIALVKSPYMLFKGWQRLIHDMISREGPFLESACIPIAGLMILMWPLVVIGSIVMAIFSSFFIGLYSSVIVYQERSFRRGLAYVIAMVAEFDEYTNDWLYLREGSILPKPNYRKRMPSETSFRKSQGQSLHDTFGLFFPEAPGVLVPSLTASQSVREAMKEVKMVQVWENIMKSCEVSGKELLDRGVLTQADLNEWLKSKQTTIIDAGLPTYAFLRVVLRSIESNSDGLVLIDGTELNQVNRPHDRLLDWFFHPILVLKEQIRVLRLEKGEIGYVEKVVLFGNNKERLKSWENGSFVPKDPLRAAQIEGICRRMMGMSRSVSKFPTYRRKYRRVVRELIIHSFGKDCSIKSWAFSGSNEGSNRGLSSESLNRSMSAARSSAYSIDIV